MDDYLRESEFQSTHVNAVSEHKTRNYNIPKSNPIRRNRDIAYELSKRDQYDSDNVQSDEDESFAQITFVIVPMDKQEMKCFHCGIKGHMVGECDIAKKNLPQTTKGQMAWAEFCKLRGEARVYDVNYQLDRHEQWQKRKRYDNRSNQRTFSNNKPATISISSDSDITSRDDAISVSSSSKDEVNDRPQRSTRSKDKSKDTTIVSNAIYGTSDVDISEASDVDEYDITPSKTIFHVSHLGANIVEDIKKLRTVKS